MTTTTTAKNINTESWIAHFESRSIEQLRVDAARIHRLGGDFKIVAAIADSVKERKVSELFDRVVS